MTSASPANPPLQPPSELDVRPFRALVTAGSHAGSSADYRAPGAGRHRTVGANLESDHEGLRPSSRVRWFVTAVRESDSIP